ncbi:IS30 family transposase [Serratia sp. JSRIV001]|uniref:IS30 family transposase n=1 Tax=unclassified Serratia (in: enterobacteria) TaxID=2647522 RepID=UPI001CBE44C0|nr:MULTISPECIES: IS30 family transposase [unclassified Serratia (in: enterobacteria)]UAN45184.1 IS30 family transposase [Serratia sp. JSRIV001]UAN65858.1 IS30 family transposase [Serratia sp. JSRIV006]
MQGKHLTQKERFYIEKRRDDGVNQATIARELQLPRSTISRELRRNTDAAFNGVYSCRRAEKLARGRRQKARPDNVVNQFEPHIQEFIRHALSTHTSPEVISGRLFLELGLSVSKNSLYRYIQQERQAGGDLYQQLPHRGKRYNYQTDQANRGPIPNRVGIEHRPAEADLKQQPGHFEIDTIFGKDQKSFLLTVVDKAVKLVIIRKLPNKRAETVVAAFRDIVANTFCEFKTLTADNGPEFSQHEEITKITGATVYFARPYHSWERGLNEHTSGLIRRFYPKGTDFNQVTHRKVAALEHLLNTRGRKCLGYRSPNEVFLTHLQAA